MSGVQRAQGDALGQLEVMLRASERGAWDQASRAASAELGVGLALVVVELTSQLHGVAGGVGLGAGLDATQALSAEASPARPVLARDASLVLGAEEARRWGLGAWVEVIEGRATAAAALMREDRAIGALVAAVDGPPSGWPQALEALDRLARGVSGRLSAPGPGGQLGPVDPRALCAVIEATVLGLRSRIERLDRLSEQLWPALVGASGPALSEAGPRAARWVEEIWLQLGSLRRWLLAAREIEPSAWEASAGALLLLGRAAAVLRPALALAGRLGSGGLEPGQAREAWRLLGSPDSPVPLAEACARLELSLEAAASHRLETDQEQAG